uniref:Uncharacterized protein n=1 Tax=Panagrolaimus sp. ES5 TaxID=591445 RepID=A0AC34GUI9_9BILA
MFLTILFLILISLAICSVIDTLLFDYRIPTAPVPDPNEMIRRRNWQEYMRRLRREAEIHLGIENERDQHIEGGYIILNNLDFQNPAILHIIARGQVAQERRR